ncbi:MAG: exonuclease SbcCD subunit D [Bacteroidales bacterium]|nr:exonuclease SbcCD subunit D [Bacteroidales bacterium]
MALKILHTADWHLGQRFYDNSRVTEHRHFLNWLITQLAHTQPDVLIVAGDVYDGVNPSGDSERLFFDFLERAIDTVEGLQILITAGNHDGGGRLEATASLAARQRIFLRGTVQRISSQDNTLGQPAYDHLLLPLRSRTTEQAEALALLVPFLRPNDVGGYDTEAIQQFFKQLHHAADGSRWGTLPRILVAHLYTSGTDLSATDEAERYVVGGQAELPAETLGHTAYTALGHIHKAMRIQQSQAWYAGSPIPLSFAELGYTHGVNLVTLDDKGQAHVERLVHTPLRRLQRLPERGAVSVDELFKLANRLPAAEEHPDATTWPYLEVCLRSDAHDYEQLRELRELLATRAVVFCKFTRLDTPLPEATADTGVESLAHFVQATPREMLERIYRNKHQDDLPEALATRFAEVEAAIAKQEPTDTSNA